MCMDGMDGHIVVMINGRRVEVEGRVFVRWSNLGYFGYKRVSAVLHEPHPPSPCVVCQWCWKNSHEHLWLRHGDIRRSIRLS